MAKKQKGTNGYFFHSNANLLIVVANGDNPLGLTKHLKKEIEAHGVSMPTYMATNSYVELPMGDKNIGIFAWDNTKIAVSLSSLHHFIEKRAEKGKQIALLFPGEDDSDININRLVSLDAIKSVAISEIYFADHSLWEEPESAETP